MICALAKAKTLIFNLLTYMASLELHTSYDENLQMVCSVHFLWVGTGVLALIILLV
jgi:hypothetical protein